MADTIYQLLEYSLQEIGGIGRASSRAIRLLEIAEIFLGRGDPTRCLETLAKALQNIDLLKQPLEKAKLLAWTARLSCQAGDGAGARAQFLRAALLARAMETASQKEEALYRLACEYAGAGLEEETERALEELYGLMSQGEGGIEAVQGLIDIAEIYADISRGPKAAELLAEASDRAPAVRDSWFRIDLLSEIAAIYAGAGFPERASPALEQALSALEQIGEASRLSFLLKIADVYKDLGSELKTRDVLQKALEVVDHEELAYSKSRGLVEVARRYWQMGDQSASISLVLRAGKIAEGIEDIRDKIASLTEIGLELGTAGQREKALDMADKALALGRQLEDKRAKVYLLGKLVRLYSDLDSGDRAAAALSEIIRLVQEYRVQTSGLAVIAVDLAEAGKYSLALELAQVLREPEARSAALTGIAGSLVEANRELDEQAKRVAMDAGKWARR